MSTTQLGALHGTDVTCCWFCPSLQLLKDSDQRLPSWHNTEGWPVLRINRYVTIYVLPCLLIICIGLSMYMYMHLSRRARVSYCGPTALHSSSHTGRQQSPVGSAA